MQLKSGVKKFGCDMMLNVVSYGLPIIVLQFIVLPLMSRFLGTEEYGLLLTLTSIVSIAGEMTGGTIANVRLIFDIDYKKKNINGDYKQLLTGITGLALVILTGIFAFGYHLHISDILLLLLYYTFFSYRSYLTVGYRLELKYNLVFVNNIVLCVGYAIGLGAAYWLQKWELVYIIGFIASTIHLFFTTKLKYDSWIRTELFVPVMKKTLFLMFAYLIGNSMNYFDRVLLYPIVGGAAVSEYYVATVFGKVLNLLITPINMVLLSYLSKKETIRRKEVIICFSGLTILGAIFVVSSKVLAPIVLNILYPDYVDKVSGLILLATCSAVLMACTSLFKTLSMRYTSEKKIFLTEIIYIASYVVLALILLSNTGLVGFCYATAIASIIRFAFFFFGLMRVCSDVRQI